MNRTLLSVTAWRAEAWAASALASFTGSFDHDPAAPVGVQTLRAAPALLVVVVVFFGFVFARCVAGQCAR